MTTTYDPTSLIAGDFPLAHRKVTIASGQANLKRGTVLGRVSLNAGAVTVSAGVLTGTGNGTLTLANPAYGAGVQEGDYKVIAVEKTTDSGEFIVQRPDGTIDGRAIVGTAYDGQIKFTIADSTTDYAQDSVWTVHVAIADTGAGKYVTSLAAAADGSQVPRAVLATDCDATSADKDAPAYFTGEFAAERLTYGTGHDKDTVEAAFVAAGASMFVRQLGTVA